MTETLLHNTNQRIQDLQFQLKYLLDPIEKSRLEINKRSKIFWIATIATLLICGSLLWYFQHMIMIAIIIVAIIAISIAYFYWINSPKGLLIDNFNKNIVPHIVAEFLNDSSFCAEQYISENEYYNSELFRQRVDRYNGRDLISGILGKTFLKFSWLHLEYKTQERTKNGGTRTKWHTIFKGIFLIADSNKNVQGFTSISPDIAERAFGGVGRWFQEKFGAPGRGEMVYMENSIFEKLYVVYATDPVEARYLLTPNVQQYFIDLAEHIGKDCIHASFSNGKLYLALSGSFELFSFKMNKSVTDTETIKYYTENLLHIIKTVEILDLNTRIWGK